MLEQCPTCTAKVLFTTNICPRCQVDRTNPTPSKVVDWRLQNERVQAEQEESKVPKKRDIRLSVGAMLVVGGFFVGHAAVSNSQYIRSMGSPHTPMVGLTISYAMKILGALLIFMSVFRRKH
jgi:hypothetical protein